MINGAYSTYFLYLKLLLFILPFFNFMSIIYWAVKLPKKYAQNYIVLNFLTYAIKEMQYISFGIDKPCKQRELLHVFLPAKICFELWTFEWKKNAVYIRPNSINIIFCTCCQLQNNLFLKIWNTACKAEKNPDQTNILHCAQWYWLVK